MKPERNIFLDFIYVFITLSQGIEEYYVVSSEE